jgi:hypothetical protein
MTWTYTTSPLGTRDFVRLMVSDTDSTNPIFQDEELDALLSRNSGDPRLAAADALDALANKYAMNAISYSVTGFSMNRTAIAAQLRSQAKQLRDVAMSEPFEFESITDNFIDVQGFDRSNYSDTPGNV